MKKKKSRKSGTTSGIGWGAGQPGALGSIRGVMGAGTTAGGDLAATPSGGNASRGKPKRALETTRGSADDLKRKH